MTSPFKNVAIFGAGGNLGPAILQALLSNPQFNVTVISRQESKSTFPPNVKVIRADYTSLSSLTEALKGQDAAVAVVGGSALGDQNILVDAAVAAGVKRFLPSEYGSDTTNPGVSNAVPVAKAKLAIVEYIKSKGGAIEWSSIITGPFFDWGLKVGFVLGLDHAAKTAKLIDGGSAPFSTSTLPQIGRAVVATLTHAEETKNQYVYISSFTVSEKEILAEVEKAKGTKYEVIDVKSEDLLASGRAKLGKGDFSGIADLIKAVAFGELGDLRAKLWDERLGLPKEDLAEVVRGAVGA